MDRGLGPERIRVVVLGRVQGVGYRWSCRHEAERLGLTGWVRNRPDGAVELEAEGDRADLDRLVAWCRRGPGPARVTGVAVTGMAVTGVAAGGVEAGGAGFLIRR